MVSVQTGGEVRGMGPGVTEGGEGADFVVEEPDPELYNVTSAHPPVWQPAPSDILLMFEKLEAEQVLPLKWTCPGRRPPEQELPELPLDHPSDDDDDDEDKEEEKSAPEPSAFDFDDTASEASAKVKLTPRTPAQAKRPEKRVARMDNVINSLKRQQKAEREARKSQARNINTTPLRGGTPSRLSALSPAASPRLAGTTASPGPSSPRGSPHIPPSPSSRPPVSDSGLKPEQGESLSNTNTGTASPAAQGVGETTSKSPKLPPSDSAATKDAGGVGASGDSTASGDGVRVKAESLEGEAVAMETDSAKSADVVAVKLEG